MNRRRVVVTGVSVLAPGSIDTEGFWSMITAGRTAIRRISAFDPAPFRSQVGGEIDFDPLTMGLTHRESRRLDRASMLAVVCARRAIEQAGIGADIDRLRVGVTVGNAVGSATSVENEYVVLSDDGTEWFVDERYASAHLFDYFTPGSIAREVAQVVDAEGPVSVISAGCTSGIDSIGHAATLIEEGSADVMVAGATDAPITPIAVACFDAIRATTPDNDDPATAAKPFDRRRSGFAIAEGSAMFVLEEFEHARQRGAQIFGEIAGYSSTCNAHHMTGLTPEGEEMTVAINRAMASAQAVAGDIDYVNAHGSGTKQNDIHETAAIKRSLGTHAFRVPVSSIKSMVGHSLGAIGSIEIAACILAMRDSLVPPTANLHEPDPLCDLDYVPLTAREAALSTVLTVGSGFGGFQSAMVLRKVSA
ncbi:MULTISPECIES: beta-ketoacyl-[acyl-carrier-protein] synthase family protein [unclassified Rhodococcus (in: high G+C Gram-positive bacteria)]|uniref:beta-ketoacyl-[acyl-carrier-protein] synthase family protein n=1 Tax=unclassified Rhodococcus (in: high G+C Gram-positive bacteria) TaxID=192944 RepID=UPI0029554C32|nr:beta-ketoacyl-[acyl-carrier-protein] synthase family protein [Rhodococcus sp. IEGM 1318]MDV8009329.1 beta-ketoacyl-[acyl-carrier-protein] synthase family protein [Rhodococcus sp. IEGM 1318]MDZ7917371.1 beta-ketoacyl-[acyl-carrier-protein] synthase family protein [Rhodococcus sp. (in: high G+C Gram-positive bacteria)]